MDALEKKYYNFRFPKNGRYPTYMDMMSLYPYFQMTAIDWSKYNLSDIDFFECLRENENKQISYNDNILTQYIRTFNFKYNVITNNGMYYIDDFVAPISDDKMYNNVSANCIKSDVYNTTFIKSIVYFGYPARFSYSANRCYMTIRNPYEFDDNTKSDKNVVSFDSMKLPTQVIHTSSSDNEIKSYVLYVSNNRLVVTDDRVFEDPIIHVTATGIVYNAFGYGSSIYLNGDDYYIQCILFDSTGTQISMSIHYLDETSSAYIDVLEDFGNVRFMTDEYYFVLYLQTTLAFTNISLPSEKITIKRVKPYTSFRIGITDNSDKSVSSFNVLSPTKVIPDPFRVKVYGSNEFVTDEQITFTTDCVKYEVYSGDKVIGFTNALVNNGDYALGHISSQFYNTFSWYDATSVKVSYYTKNEYGVDYRQCSRTYQFVDNSTAESYFTEISETEEIKILNRSELSVSSVTATLKGILNSGNIAPVTSSTHTMNVYLLNVDGEQIGQVLYDHRFINSATFVVNMSELTTGSGWNWFEVETIVFQLVGFNLVDNYQIKTINFIPEPDESCVVEYDITSDVDSIICSEEGILSQNTIQIEIEYSIEEVIFSIAGTQTVINVAAYSYYDNTIPITELKSELEDDIVDIDLTELPVDYTKVSKIGITLYKSINNRYELINGVYLEIPINFEGQAPIPTNPPVNPTDKDEDVKPTEPGVDEGADGNSDSE